MRAADDFTVIRARMEQLQRERLGRCETEQRTARTDAHIGLGVWLECMYLTFRNALYRRVSKFSTTLM